MTARSWYKISRHRRAWILGTTMDTEARQEGSYRLRGNPERQLGGWVPRIAGVSFLNALPLIDGFVGAEYIRMARDVPSRLSGKLIAGRIDAALLPVIELQRMDEPPVILPGGCIASNGPTMTVRIFSRLAPATIQTLHVDPDSQTSVALASVLWAESFGRRLRIRTLESMADLVGPHRPQAVLLIGDKVITRPPTEYAWQIDLGEAWQVLTDLPFVFAIWAMRRDPLTSVTLHQTRAAALNRVLTTARERGMARIEEIAARHGPTLGWDPVAAAQYLTEHIQYKFTDEHRRGMETFFKLAHTHQIIDKLQPLSFADM